MLCFDQNTESQFNNIFTSIIDGGVSNYMVEAKVPPHITVAYFSADEIEPIINEMDSHVSEFSTGNIIWASLGTFVPKVLFAAPVMNEYLLNTCINANRLIKPLCENGEAGRFYLPYNWVPHTTLALDLDNESLKKAFGIVSQQFTFISGQGNRLLLVEAKSNPYNIIKTWELI